MRVLRSLVALGAASALRRGPRVSTSRALLSTTSRSLASQGKRGEREVLALDFDGVICASSGESSYTSLLAACDFWPQKVSIPADSNEFRVIKEGVHRLRPIVETGYENMLLVRYLHEELQKTGKVDVEGLMKTWTPELRDALLKSYGSDKVTMIRAFGDSRDALIAKDLAFWVDLNEIYPCASASLAGRRVEYTIVTTKQARFVRAILTRNQIAPPPDDKLFDLENPFGPKTKVLQAMLRGLPATSAALSANDLARIPVLPQDQRPFIHFVEDRVETLLAILESGAELRDNTKLYLVEHGYNTEAQRELARQHKDITLLTPAGFEELVSSFSLSADTNRL